MRCPFCNHEETQVRDSRSMDNGFAIKRRRLCTNCSSKFNTFEHPHNQHLTVVKRDGSQQRFDKEKIQKSILIALRKRDCNKDHIDNLVLSIYRKLVKSGYSEITSSSIGEMVMDGLKSIDHIAYIRYASVYKNFTEVHDFTKTMKDLIED